MKYVHPFPARMAPAIVLSELDQADEKLRVLDPMVGSGVTLAVARLRGHFVIGFDTDPLAVLIASVACSDVNSSEVKHYARVVLRRAESALAMGPIKEMSYPQNADEETRCFVRYWFDISTRRQLYALSTAISRVRSEGVKSYLWCALSRLIITKSRGVSLGRDISHSRPHRWYHKSPIKPFDFFERSIDWVLKASPFAGGSKLPPAKISLGDARRLGMESSSADIVITSPPYLNAIDYLRAHKFSLIWQGYSIGRLRSIRSENIGTERICETSHLDPDIERALAKCANPSELSDHRKAVLRRYLLDMQRVLSEIHRVLIPGGRLCLVVGDSTHQGVFIRNSVGIQALARGCGLQLFRKYSRPITECRRYLPPPDSKKSRSSLDKRMRYEVIMSYRKN